MAEGQSSLDPAFARNQANVWATTQLYNGLFELSAELYPQPDLADTWEISEDGTEYTFKIKPGVFFHDSEVFENGLGREVRASDFVYSFKRIVNPATGSTGAWVFNDKIKRQNNGEVDPNWVEALDDYTLRIRLEQPFSPFLELLTVPYTFVVPLEAVEKYGKDFRRNPVGTGPFAFKSWDEGESLIMLKNAKYHKTDLNGRQLPYVDAVQVSFVADKAQELRNFMNQNLDFVSGTVSSAVDLILNDDGTVKEEFQGKFTVQMVPYMNTEYIGFNLDPKAYDNPNHPFLNPTFRQALSYAVDREKIVSFLLNNLGQPGTAGMVPPAMPSFSDDRVKGFTYDADKAAQLLAQAGYPEGQGLPDDLTLYTTSQSKALMEQVQKYWDAIGVKINIEINQAATHQELVDNGKVNLWRGSWLGDYPDAENYLALFYSKFFAPNGPNKTHFVSARYDSLYEAAQMESDGFRRFDTYHEMDRLVMDQSPVIVLFYDKVLRVMQPNVTGLEPNVMNMLKLEQANFQAVNVIQ